MSGAIVAGVVITNPLVKYRALVATKSIRPDPGQLRLAIRLQKLYDELKDYEPEVNFSQRLNQIRSLTDHHQPHVGSTTHTERQERRSIWRSLVEAKEKRDSLALTRRLTSHQATLELTSPRGLMVHGEVGTGKSMLIDLFAECLPHKRKRRWHFNTFMLHALSKLETFRIAKAKSNNRPTNGISQDEDDYSLAWLAKDMIETNPILFLDEFQMPDRVASKILINLMTSFFQLGGVLIATSNRMPEELAQATGIGLTPPSSRMEALQRSLGFKNGTRLSGIGLYHGQNEFAQFLEVLKARCEVWEMRGNTDYRRLGSGTARTQTEKALTERRPEGQVDLQHEDGMDDWSPEESDETSRLEDEQTPVKAPPYYHILHADDSQKEGKPYNLVLSELTACKTPDEIIFVPDILNVYGRKLSVPRSYNGICEWTFTELCKGVYGPADYITLASTFHTFIVRDIPVLTWFIKNEARRFITLLDALYECRCKLYVYGAAGGPDEIFFPEGKDEEDRDAVYSETISEVYQDATAPFRPNILKKNPEYAESDPQPDYTHAGMSGFLRPNGAVSDNANADSIVDSAATAQAFGRRYGLADAEMYPPTRSSNEGARGPDFSRTSVLTGEDELFAFRRAQSRLWELCGQRWWARTGDDWHRPLSREVRYWEAPISDRTDTSSIPLGRRPVNSDGTSDVQLGASTVDETRNAKLFRHGSSPFRTVEDAPPSFDAAHAWGMTKWGPKAGAWGQGVEGLKDRNRR